MSTASSPTAGVVESPGAGVGEGKTSDRGPTGAGEASRTARLDEPSASARTLKAPPSLWRILPLHALAIMLLQSTSTCVGQLLPVIAKKEFGAGDFQTTIITAAPNVLALVSIFWGAWYGRTRVTLYLAAYFVVAYVPLAFWSLSTGYWQVATLAVLAALGSAGYTPIAASLLERYPAAYRGKVFAVILTLMFLGAGAGAYGLGAWLNADRQAFRAYLPLATGLQFAGVVLVLTMLWRTHPRGRAAGAERGAAGVPPATRFWTRVAFVLHPAGLTRSALGAALNTVAHMGVVLREDRIFARYEAAFMTYGLGWMVGWALVPIYVTEHLKLDYETIAHDWSFTVMVTSAIVTLPAGYLVDRLGAMRTCMIAFGIYAAWPILLMLADGPRSLVASSIVFGVASSLVNMGWMLGPVSLAPTREKVPQYIAIHTTMVGLRGTVGQFAGVAIYSISGSFVVPLLIAAVSFVWASVQMQRLHHVQRRSKAGLGV